MKQKASNQKILSFIMLEASFIYIIYSISNNIHGWYGDIGYFLIGITIFIYSWILYFYNFQR